MFLYRLLKNCSQKYPKLTSSQPFEVDIPGNFQKWMFLFQFSRHFVLKRFPFYGTVGFLTRLSVNSQKPHLKIPKTHLCAAFWSWHLWKFSKISFHFSQFSRNFFFRLIPGFLRLHHKCKIPLKYSNNCLQFLTTSKFLTKYFKICFSFFKIFWKIHPNTFFQNFRRRFSEILQIFWKSSNSILKYLPAPPNNFPYCIPRNIFKIYLKFILPVSPYNVLKLFQNYLHKI